METPTQVPVAETGQADQRQEDEEFLRRAAAAERLGLKLHPADLVHKSAAELRTHYPDLFGKSGAFAFLAQTADFIGDFLQVRRLESDSLGVANLDSPEITQEAGLAPAVPIPAKP